MNKITIIGIALLLILCFSACTISSIPPSEQTTLDANALNLLECNYQDGDMVTCFLSGEDYYKFIENPTIEKIVNSTSSISLYRMMDSENEPVQRITISNNGIDVFQSPSGFLRVSNLDRFIVYESTVAFLGNKNEIEIFLKDSGYDCRVVNAVVVTSMDLPFLLWVQCEETSYFITIDEYYYADRADDIHAEEYIYRIYSPAEFLDKISAA